MRFRLLIAAIVTAYVPLADAAAPRPRPAAAPLAVSLVAPDSILNRPVRRPARPRLRLIQDDETGRASLSLGADSFDSESDSPVLNLEPTDPEVLADESLDEPPPIPPLSGSSLNGDAVPLDGAAESAEAPPVPEWAHANASFAWVGGTGNQLGMLEWTDRSLVTLYDYSSEQNSFHVDPGFIIRWLTGPDTPDLPPYLFNIAIDTAAIAKFGDSWTMHLAMSPSWNTDFANKSADLFRLPWQVVNVWRLDSEWRLVGGVTDLDREDIQYLPVAGVMYYPNSGQQEWSLVFPRPRAAWRLDEDGTTSTWFTVSGELGGGSYSILRSAGFYDIATLRDYRLLAGWELRNQRRHLTRVEVGWVFGRAVEYASGIGNYNPGSTGMLRLTSEY